MNNSQEIRNIIVDNIKKRGQTAKECLIACNINTSFLTDWKNEKIKQPSYEKIVKLAEYLNIDLSYLFLGSSTTSNLDEKEEECLKQFRLLTPIDRIRIIEHMVAWRENYPPEKHEPHSDEDNPSYNSSKDKRNLA